MKLLKSLAVIISLFCMTTACGGNSNSDASASAEAAAPAAKAPKKEAKKADPVIKLAAGEQLPANNGKPMVLDFNATWCGPCRQFTPIFHSVAEDFAGRVTFVSIDVDRNPELAAQFGVQSIPYVVYLKPDGTATRSIGLISEGEFAARVTSLLH